MPSIQDTAYPRLRSQLSARELADISTPTREEVDLARSVTKGEVARLGFLVLLKTFQRLGYPVALTDVPASVIEHVCASLRHLAPEH